MSGAAQPGAQQGAAITSVNTALTAAFTVATLIAAVLFDQPWKVVSVVVDLACFGLGVIAFLWGYWNAVQRSRTESIGVAQLYFLLGDIVPRTVRVRMNLLLAVQVTVGIAGAVVRGSTDGKPGSTLAFGILVPMLGLGLNGLLGAFHGTFPPRQGPGAPGVSPAGDANGQD